MSSSGTHCLLLYVSCEFGQIGGVLGTQLCNLKGVCPT